MFYALTVISFHQSFMNWLVKCLKHILSNVNAPPEGELCEVLKLQSGPLKV